jgi:hypothetical protein
MNENLSLIMVINNSGIILSKLNSIKECGFYDLMILSGLDEMDFYLAVGYLLSEKKIIFVPNSKEILICIVD